MTTYTNVFSGSLLQLSQQFYEAITLSANITLSWSTDFGSSSLVVASIMDISPTAGGFTVTLPDARNVSVGLAFSINNPTVNTFTLKANDGSTISAMNGPSFNTLYLTNNTTQSGTWRLIPFIGTTAVTSVAVSTSGTSGNLITSGSPITVSGTIGLTLGADLLGLTSLGTNVGLAVRTTTGGAWGTTFLTGTTSQIVLSNASGVFGSPTIGLASAIAGNVDSIQLSGGNLNIGLVANTIAANNANGPLYLQSVGTGSINLTAGSTGNINLGVGSSGSIRAYNDVVLKNTAITLQDSSLSNSVSLFANGVSSTYSLALPGSIGTSSQVLGISSAVGSVAALTWLNAPTFSGISTINTVPIFTSAAGSLGDSTVTITGAGLNVIGATSRINLIDGVGTINMALIGATNTITSIVGDLHITAPGGSFVGLSAPQYMLNTQPLYFSPTSVGTDQFVAFKSPAAGTIVGNPIWTLPIRDAVSPGQFLSSNAAGTLSWVSGSTGTVTSITATAPNLTGGVITTTGTIGLNPVLTGLTSITLGTIRIGSPSAIDITSTGALALNATGLLALLPSTAVQVGGGVGVIPLRFYDTDASNYVSFQSAGVVPANVQWVLPSADATISGQALTSNAALALSWTSVGTVTSVTAGTNLTGGVITTTGTIALSSTPTGLTSLGVGTFTASGTSLTTSGAMDINATGVMTLNPTTAIKLGSGAGVVPLRFYNAVGTFYNGLQAGNPGANVTWTLPTVDGVANRPLVTSGGTVLSFATTVSATNLTTTPADSSGGLTGAGGPIAAFNTDYQNLTGYDVMLMVYLNITVNTTGVIACGVSSGASPPQQTVFSGLTSTGFITIPVYWPSNYYFKITNSGGITLTIVASQITPV